MERDYSKIFEPCQIYDENDKTEYKYRFYKPRDYNGKDPLPLIFALHGGGSRGTDNFKQLDQVQVTVWSDMIESGEIEPCFIAAPQLPPQFGFFMESNCVFAVFDDVKSKYAVDSGRVYLTGTSMGGMGAWSCAAKAPDKFTAFLSTAGIYPDARFSFPVGKTAPAFQGDVKKEEVPESEYLPAMRGYAKALCRFPIRHFHSVVNATSPVSFAYIMEKCMEDAGAYDCKFCYFSAEQQVAHGQTYSTVIEQHRGALHWLLAQKKK